jgi:hypothetical protein
MGSYLDLGLYYEYKTIIILLFIFIIIEWLGRENQYAIEKMGLNWPKAARWSFYYVIAMAALLFSGQQQEFIYFQF